MVTTTHSYPCDGHGFVVMFWCPTTKTTLRQSLFSSVRSPTSPPWAQSAGNTSHQSDLTMPRPSPSSQGGKITRKVLFSSNLFFSRWTNIIFSSNFLFQPTRMIELDGRSLMNRKKEAALLDMVEKYFLLQRWSRYNDSEDTVVITDWPGCIRNQIPTIPTYICTFVIVCWQSVDQLIQTVALLSLSYKNVESTNSNDEQGRKSAYVEIQGVGKGGVREKWIRVRHKYKYTNTNAQIQIHKYKYTNTNTNTQIQIHKYTNTNTNTQIKIHKYKYKYTN